MDQTDDIADASSSRSKVRRQHTGWLAGGSLLAALGVTSCCVLPLALVLAGVSGAWIGTLTALEPYKPIFAVIAIGLIGLGFWQVYGRRTKCDDRQGGRTVSSLTVQMALWTSTMLVALALTAGVWAPLFY